MASITITLHLGGCDNLPTTPFSSLDFNSEEAKKMLVKINNQHNGEGYERTGFVVGMTEDGKNYILTAPHDTLLKGKEEKIKVTLPGNSTVDADIVGDPRRDYDIAVLSADINLLEVPYFFALKGFALTGKEGEDECMIVGYKIDENSSLHYSVTCATSIVLTGFSSNPRGLSGSPVFLKNSGKIIGMVKTEEGNLEMVPIGVIKEYLKTFIEGKNILKQQEDKKISPLPIKESSQQKREKEPKNVTPDKPQPLKGETCPTEITIILADNVLNQSIPNRKKCQAILDGRSILEGFVKGEKLFGNKYVEEAYKRLKEYEEFSKNFCE